MASCSNTAESAAAEQEEEDKGKVQSPERVVSCRDQFQSEESSSESTPDVHAEAIRRHRQQQRAADKMKFLANSRLESNLISVQEKAAKGDNLALEELVAELQELRGTVSDMRGRCQLLQEQVDVLTGGSSEVCNERWSCPPSKLAKDASFIARLPPKLPRSWSRTSSVHGKNSAERYLASGSFTPKGRRASCLKQEGVQLDGRREQPLTSWPRCSFSMPEADASIAPRALPVVPGALPKGLDSPKVRWSLHKERFIAASPQREKDRCSTVCVRPTVTFNESDSHTPVPAEEPKLRRSITTPLPLLLGRRGCRAATEGCALQTKASSSDTDLGWPSLNCPDNTPPSEDAGTESEDAFTDSVQTAQETPHGSSAADDVTAGSNARSDETDIKVLLSNMNSPSSQSPHDQIAPQGRISTDSLNSGEDAGVPVAPVCADAAAGPVDASPKRKSGERSSGLDPFQVCTKRRSSLDSGYSQMTSIALSPSDVTSRTLSTLWATRSINVFELQKEVVNAHAESPCQDLPEDGAVYVGIPGSMLISAKLGWCQKNLPFRRLGLILKLLGVVCAYPSYTAGPGESPAAARLRHILALLYIAAWQLSIWSMLVVHASQVMAAGPQSSGRYGVAVRGVMLLASSAAHFTSIQFFGGGGFADLTHYASRSVFIQSWATASQHVSLALLAPFSVFATASFLAEGPWFWSALQALTWVPLIVQYQMFLTTLQFCSLGLDAFALELLNTTVLAGLVGRFDKLHAAMRRSAYAVQVGLTVFVTAVFAVLFATVYHLMFAGFDTPAENAAEAAIAPWRKQGDVAGAILVVVLFLLGLHLLNQIATVNAKCKRLPVLIQSLNFGVEIDHDKWCVAAHIASLEAGFFVYNVPVTRWSVLKFGYFSLATASFLLTRLVFAV